MFVPCPLIALEIVLPRRPRLVAGQLALDCAKEYAPCAGPLNIFSSIYPEMAAKGSRKGKNFRPSADLTDGQHAHDLGLRLQQT